MADPITFSPEELGHLEAAQAPPTPGQMGVYTDREGGIQNLVPNAVKDVPVITGGLAAVGAVPFMRAYEATPTVQTPFGEVGGGSQPLVRPTDLPQLIDTAKGVGQYIHDEYIKPYMQIHDKQGSMFPLIPPDYLGYVENEFTKAPLQVGADLLPAEMQVSHILGGAGTKLAGRIVKSTAIADKMAELSEKSPMAKWYKDNVLPGLTKEMSPNSTVHQHLADSLAKLDRIRLDKINEGMSQLDKLWSTLSDDEKMASTAVGEHTDTTLRKYYAGNTNLQKFLDYVRGFNTKMESVLKMPEDVNLRNKWGAPYLATQERARRASLAALDAQGKLPTNNGERSRYLAKNYPNLAEPLRFEDLGKPEHMKALVKYKQRANKLGMSAPMHAAIATQGQLAAAFHNAFASKLGGIMGSKTAQAAKSTARAGMKSPYEAGVALPPWLIERAKAHVKTLQGMQSIREAKHSLNTRDLTLYSIVKLAQFEAVRDYVEEIMKTPPGKDWLPVDMKGMMKNLAVQTGFDENKVDKMFKDMERKTGIAREEPGVVKLPPKTAQLVKEVLEGKERSNALWRLVDKWNGVAKMARFTLDPTFPIRLAVQTASVSAWAVNTPKQAMGLLTSHLLALHPGAKDAIPDAIMLSHGGEGLRPKMLYSGLTWERMMNWPKVGLQAINDVTYRHIHGVQRRAAALNFLLYTLRKSPLGDLFGDLLNMSNALEIAKNMTFSEENLRKMHDFMANHFGDYSSDINKTPIHQAAGRAVLVWAWVRHAMNLIKTIPQHPYKSAILRMISDVASKQLQPPREKQDLKEQGYIAMTKGGKYFRGMPVDFAEAGLSMLGAAAATLWGEGGLTVSSTMAPGAATLAEFGLKGAVDVKTGKKFLDENPNIYQRYGKYYDRKTRRQIPKDELGKYSHPNLFTRLLENTFTKQFDFVKGITTKEGSQLYVPAQGSFPGKMMTKRGGIKRTGEDFWLKAIGFSVRE